jgi:hypothetical protein
LPPQRCPPSERGRGQKVAKSISGAKVDVVIFDLVELSG